MSNILSGLIWVQTVSKDYQQTTEVGERNCLLENFGALTCCDTVIFRDIKPECPLIHLQAVSSKKLIVLSLILKTVDTFQLSSDTGLFT